MAMRMCKLFVAALAMIVAAVNLPAEVGASKAICDPDKRRNARVLTQLDVPVGADLAGVDLRCGNYASIEFKEVNLQGAKLDGATLRNLKNVNADGASFIKATVGAPGGNVVSGSFRNANFSGARLFAFQAGSVFDGANFSNAQVVSTRDRLDGPISWVGANFSRARLSGPYVGDDFTRAKFSGLRRGTPPNFTSGVFIKSDFSKADLLKANFDKSNLTGAKFDGAKIQGATFYGATLTGVNLKTAIGKAFGLTK